MRHIHFSLPGIHCLLEVTRESPQTRERAIWTEFRRRNVFFDGPHSDWRSAKAASVGYDAPAILAKVIEATRAVVQGRAAYERDTVVFQERSYSHPLLAWLLYVASRSDLSLKVVDFGGALGSSYFQHRSGLAHLAELKWCVVEQPHFVSAGRAEFEDERLSFSDSLDEAIDRVKPNVVLLSGVLQYLEYPLEYLESLLSRGVKFILIDRTAAQFDVAAVPFVQHVPAWIYSASYPVWFLNADEMQDKFAKHGYEVLDRFQPNGTFGFVTPPPLQELKHWGIGVTPAPQQHEWPYVGWFLEKLEI
ncbi:TIGR04325 family methyltransferase [Rhizobium lentis]|uniref:Methyltransferase, TIGR04325 family n=1 Tax=Rhizobium lentis TaxID=1138194 RepID=A0ABS7IGJ6_9HYPH|nr:TIGR04325 family methyltransferase [Rhizobium lentis]MBX4954779.1 methyltransferase, TIGR04325 family [Rhizobium lentis]MBX4976511.1 methyltransferase, TIGR04325 family [Rhizobium lentis]MBX4985714.1 methyltransferase, TIGR04325 family [Rhizobium lentis]MBX5004158.1 methyltransferase, TIGR04325 family [Rhizobium lentis]MBX5028122.1 methyltransferase, TIGR04325 family [Rhizobium lentis]